MNQLVVAHTISDVRSVILAAKKEGCIVGVVPTMGALHAGHVSLLDVAREECDFVVATIFVNPAQFAPEEDLDKYPRPQEADLAICHAANVDLVFMPSPLEMYPEGFSSFVEVEGIASILEGEHRPTHFRGVTTVVLKLLNIITPDVAFFGQKDYQQQLLIKKMCQDLNLATEIITCPTMREPDGLALSSRNQYLNDAQRQAALSLSQALILAEKMLQSGETEIAKVELAMQNRLTSISGVSVDYVVIRDPDKLTSLQKPLSKMVALVAAQIGNTRLIDNMIIHVNE